MRRCLELSILAFLLAGLLAAEDHVSLNEAGNRAFGKGDFEEALDYYRRAEMARPETPEIYYNAANAMIETGKFESAVEKYEKALNSDNIRLQAGAYYNGGNGFFKQENYQKAIEWYQKALELNPDDMDAKYNLELARNRLREQMKREPQDQQQPQQQEQQQQEQQDQQEQQQQEQPQPEQPQDQQPQQQQEQPPGDEQAQPQDEETDEEQQKQMQPQPEKAEEMNEEDALRILNALKESEQDNQKKQKRFKIQGKYRGNDW